MPKYVLKCDDCGKTTEVTCSYKKLIDDLNSGKLRCLRYNRDKDRCCGGELKIQVGYCNIITRVHKWKKYYPNIGGRVESGK